MKRFSLLLIVELCFLLALTAQAQFKMAIGPAIGLNYNIHTGSDLPKSGSGVGLAIAGQADMSFSKTVGLLFSIYFYDNRSGSYAETESGVSSYGPFTTTRDYSASIAYLEIETLFKANLEAAPIYFVVGSSIGFDIESSYEKKTSYQGTNWPSYTDKGSIDNMNARFELKAGGGYVLPLSKSMQINSQLTFGYGPTNVIEDTKWRILTFGLLASIEFDVL